MPEVVISCGNIFEDLGFYKKKELNGDVEDRISR